MALVPPRSSPQHLRGVWAVSTVRYLVNNVLTEEQIIEMIVHDEQIYDFVENPTDNVKTAREFNKL